MYLASKEMAEWLETKTWKDLIIAILFFIEIGIFTWVLYLLDKVLLI